jgi:hypothetical protein
VKGGGVQARREEARGGAWMRIPGRGLVLRSIEGNSGGPQLAPNWRHRRVGQAGGGEGQGELAVVRVAAAAWAAYVRGALALVVEAWLWEHLEPLLPVLRLQRRRRVVAYLYRFNYGVEVVIGVGDEMLLPWRRVRRGFNEPHSLQSGAEVGGRVGGGGRGLGSMVAGVLCLAVGSNEEASLACSMSVEELWLAAGPDEASTSSLVGFPSMGALSLTADSDGEASPFCLVCTMSVGVGCA